MDTAALDWETFYDVKYSLRGLSYTDYIMDDRFAETGCAIKLNDGPTVFYEPDDIAAALLVIDWANTRLVAHNLAFDGMILKLRYGITAHSYFCTLAAARALFPAIPHRLGALVDHLGLPAPKDIGALDDVKGLTWDQMTDQQQRRLAHYCASDVDNCAAMYEMMVRFLPDSQIRAMDILFKCAFDSQLRVCVPYAQRSLEKAKQERKATIQASGYPASRLSSNPKFAAILEEDFGITVPMKESPTNPDKQTYAFAKNDLAFQDLYVEHPEAAPVLDARVAVKSTILTTRLKRFIEAQEKCGFLPMMYKPYGAHTGRIGGDNRMNVANLPRNGPLRHCILAPPGYAVVTVDSAQLECRMLHWQAESYDTLNVFATGGDIYKIRAGKIYAIDPDDVDGTERFVGKVTELGLGYTMGSTKFRYTLASGSMGKVVRLSPTEARDIVWQWRSDNWRITNLWKTAQDVWLPILMHGHGRVQGRGIEVTPLGIQLPNGLYLQYPNLRVIEDEEGREQPVYANGKRLYGGKLIENATQALANVTIQDQMVQIADVYPVCMHTYDEVSCVVPFHQADDCLDYMLAVMKQSPSWAPDLPLDAEGAYSRYYCK